MSCVILLGRDFIFGEMPRDIKLIYTGFLVFAGLGFGTIGLFRPFGLVSLCNRRRPIIGVAISVTR